MSRADDNSAAPETPVEEARRLADSLHDYLPHVTDDQTKDMLCAIYSFLFGLTAPLWVETKACIRPTSEAADAFWKYWRENGETHKHGYYESTWGAINAALNSTGQIPPSWPPDELSEALNAGADLLAHEAKIERNVSGRYDIGGDLFRKHDSRARLAAKQSDMLYALAKLHP